MATQLTLALFENIDSVRQETIDATDVVKPVHELSKTSGIPKENFIELPGLFPADFNSRIVDDPMLEIDDFDPRQIPFDIQGDPNEEFWRAVKEGMIDREKIFYEYKSLGQTVTIEGNRGIPDLAKKRALNFQQHFTPPIIARFLAQALRLDVPGTPASVVDNSCGIGRMFQFLNPSCDLVGIEVEEKAYHMARTLFPKANIINDDLINHPRIMADCFIINPPFSIQLEKKNCGFTNAGWGDLGPGTSIKSHIAAMETAIESARYFVAAMLPAGYFVNEETLTFERWVNQRAKLAYRLDIDQKAFTKHGFTWPCSLVIYSKERLDGLCLIHHQTETLDEAFLAHELEILRESEAGKAIEKAAEHIRKRGPTHFFIPKKCKPEQVCEPCITLPLSGTNRVKICLSPDASCLNLKVDNVLAALKVHEFRKSLGHEWNDGLKEYIELADVMLRRRNLLEDPHTLPGMWESLRRANLMPVIDPQFANWVVKKKKWLERQQAPFEQFIKGKDGQWICLHKDDGIKSLYPELYQERLKRLEILSIDWLWPFQKEDVARMSLKNTTLLADQMGLGKCLLPDTMVYIDGILMAIGEVWDRYHTEIHFDGVGYWSIPSKRLYTNSIDPNGRIVRSQIEMLYKQEIDEKIRTVVLADGSEVSSTLSHKFLCPDGWSNEIGKYVCVPARLLQHGYKSMNKDIVSFIAWQIAEGYERNRESPNNKYRHEVDITQKDVSVLLTLKEKFKAFGLDFAPKITIPKDGHAPHLMVIRREYRDYVERLGYVWGLPSSKKTIPKFIQELNNDCIAVFLQSYFDAESCPVLSMRSIEITTASEELINQLSMLLRRFGIWLRIKRKMKCATNGHRIKRPYWIGVIGGNGLRLFKKHIGYSIKKKQEILEIICEKKSNTNIEGIPASSIVRDVYEKTGLSLESLGMASDVYVNGTQEFSRESLQKVIDNLDRILSAEEIEIVMQNPRASRRRKEVFEKIDMNYVESVRNRLAELMKREVFYARVKSVELKDYSGPVYDLTVKEHHNFVANGCICHNTRQIIALGLLYGCRHNLIIVEPKLKDEFVKEFKTIGITDYQIITDEKHLKSLKKFNLIAYNLLWRPLNGLTKKTFAKAMRRRFQFIAIDEAHKIKAKDSEQAKAVRILKARYKLLSTGTPIANYPRNIFSLLVFGWGDATERNHYGYYGPIEKVDERGHQRGYTTGTRQFKEDFVSIEWVTPQFAQTLDTGAKSREIPKIKDPEKWWAMMCSKIVRRQRDEPEVKAHITFPKPEIRTELIKMSPEHIRHYKHWLDNFAGWFKEQLRMEKEEGHKIDQMMVLAHLTQLQFASTIPQSPKTNTKDAPWSFGPTTKQQRTVELIKEAIAREEKIIVFSERPEFQRFVREILHTKHGVKSHLFIGQQGIKERNILLNDFRNNGTNVLLATTSCGEVGLNIPEANVVVLADTSWTPSKQIQAYSRILRPQQKKKPKIFLLRAVGTIDEYMSQLMAAKSEAIDEGIDYQEAAAFDASKWLSYKDFTIKMLRSEGYAL
ncbi:MAG: hypothetical protein FIB08_01380 [Candidatus Methanoperedens sp.]|nr:hypothetical protein [Candidatus Methanoperedens sp.]